MNFIQLHDYQVKDVPLNLGLGTEELILSYRTPFQKETYLTEVTLDKCNVLEVTVYELDDKVKKYVGDSAENIFFAFNKTSISEQELTSYVDKWIQKRKHLIFNY